MKTTNTALYTYTLLLMQLQSRVMTDCGITMSNDAAKLLDTIDVHAAKLDDAGWLVELAHTDSARGVLNSFITTTPELVGMSYGIKVYANRNTIALRVSLTHSI